MTAIQLKQPFGAVFFAWSVAELAGIALGPGVCGVIPKMQKSRRLILEWLCIMQMGVGPGWAR